MPHGEWEILWQNSRVGAGKGCGQERKMGWTGAFSQSRLQRREEKVSVLTTGKEHGKQ